MKEPKIQTPSFAESVPGFLRSSQRSVLRETLFFSVILSAHEVCGYDSPTSPPCPPTRFNRSSPTPAPKRVQ